MNVMFTAHQALAFKAYLLIYLWHQLPAPISVIFSKFSPLIWSPILTLIMVLGSTKSMDFKYKDQKKASRLGTTWSKTTYQQKLLKFMSWLLTEQLLIWSLCLKSLGLYMIISVVKVWILVEEIVFITTSCDIEVSGLTLLLTIIISVPSNIKLTNEDNAVLTLSSYYKKGRVFKKNNKNKGIFYIFIRKIIFAFNYILSFNFHGKKPNP